MIVGIHLGLMQGAWGIYPGSLCIEIQPQSKLYYSPNWTSLINNITSLCNITGIIANFQRLPLVLSFDFFNFDFLGIKGWVHISYEIWSLFSCYFELHYDCCVSNTASIICHGDKVIITIKQVKVGLYLLNSRSQDCSLRIFFLRIGYETEDCQCHPLDLCKFETKHNNSSSMWTKTLKIHLRMTFIRNEIKH